MENNECTTFKRTRCSVVRNDHWGNQVYGDLTKCKSILEQCDCLDSWGKGNHMLFGSERVGCEQIN